MCDAEGFVYQLIKVMQKEGDPQVALAMSKYMRNQFSFFGVPSPKRKEIQRSWLKHLPNGLDQASKWETVHHLWNQPQRELHYVAIDWMNSWKASSIEAKDVKHLHALLTTHSWWDSIDGLAPGIIGKFIRENPEEGYTWINEWRYEANFWLRRTCIIFQLKYREQLDFELLTSLIIDNLHDKEFFIQKAIGWSLRQHAKYDAQAVWRFVHSKNMVGLAKREALKHIKHLVL